MTLCDTGRQGAFDQMPSLVMYRARLAPIFRDCLARAQGVGLWSAGFLASSHNRNIYCNEHRLHRHDTLLTLRGALDKYPLALLSVIQEYSLNVHAQVLTDAD